MGLSMCRRVLDIYRGGGHILSFRRVNLPSGVADGGGQRLNAAPPGGFCLVAFMAGGVLPATRFC